MKNGIEKKGNNESIMQRNKKIFIVAIVAVLVFVVVLLFETGSLSSLMGNSVSDNYETVRETAYRIGDVNKDGKINIVDADDLQKYVSELVEFDDYQTKLADVNQDGVVNVVDHSVLRKYVSETISGTIGTTHSIGKYICNEGTISGRYCVYKRAINSNNSNENNSETSETVREVAYRIGDVNKDGNINIVDADELQRYVGELAEFDEYQIKLADVNKDGNVNVVDQTTLRKYVSESANGTIGPTHYIGEYICNEGNPTDGYCTVKKAAINIKYGDVNKDGTVNNLDKVYLTRYLANFKDYTLDETQKRNADVNSDGKIDDIDRIILTRHLAKWNEYKDLPYKGTVEEDNANIKYGDVNKDGTVNNLDKVYLTRYLANFKDYTLDETQKRNADVNSDGKIDDIDRIILTRHLAKWNEYKDLPYKGTVEEDNANIKYGDVNSDGVVDTTDATVLSGYIAGSSKFNLTEIGKKAADVNLDGVIDTTDVSIINLYIGGSISELPYKR